MSFTDSFSGLTAREQKALEKSWAKVFADEIFPAIDEKRFSALYSDKASRPNTPVNVIVGALIIKELFDYSDDEMVENLMLDFRIQYALHTTSFEEQPLSDKTLSRFRKRRYDYETLHNKDLYHDCVKDLSASIAKLMGISGKVRRMDSVMIESNVRRLSRMELIYTCIVKLAMYVNKINGSVLSDDLKHYIDPNDFNRVIYRQRSTDADERMKQLLTDADKLLALCESDYNDSTEYDLFVRCLSEQTLGVPAELESFRVAMGEIEEAHLYADGMGIPCKALTCCGSGSVEGELYYMPGTDPVSVAGAKDKIVLMDTPGIGFFAYQDLMKAGAKAILFQYGNSYYPHTDIDQRDLREAVVGEEKKVLCAMIHSAQAVELVKNKVKQIRLEIRQKEYDGESHNVIAELPGKREEWIVLSAHYDTTSLSHGAYDNMSGCAGLLGIMEQMKGKELNYGLRFVFCGSEERGLLGSKAYVRDHEKELRQTVLNINLDMIGTYMGKFIACVSAEEKLTHYISYMAAEVGFPIAAENGVYSSDSTPFADHGVPAVSFARIANGNVAPIHCRYDVKDVMSMEQLQKDIDFLTVFTGRFANAAVCPVAREIPETIRKQLDEYLFRKRKEA